MKSILAKAIPLTVAVSMMSAVPAFAYEKNETVYTKIDADGKITYQSVNEHITSNHKETINDYSDLSDIVNTSGNEKLKRDGKNMTWSSQGKDIIYTGKTENEMPINLNISYELDGKKIKPKDVKGQSGHVKLTFKYTNMMDHQYKGEKVYTPFMVMLSSTFKSADTKNLTVNTGKIINNGETELVVGLASPGLYDSFNKMDALKELDKVVIEYDTTNFNLKSIYSIATPKLLDADDLNKVFDKIDDSYGDVNKLKDATNALVEGSKTLAEGTKTYASKMKEATDASKKLKTEGTDKLTEGYKKIDDGISQLNDGTKDLSKLPSQMKKLKDGLTQLNDALKELKNTKSNLEAKKSAGIEKMAAALSATVNAELADTTTDKTKEVLKQVSTISTQLNVKSQELTQATTDYLKLVQQISQNTSATPEQAAAAKKMLLEKQKALSDKAEDVKELKEQLNDVETATNSLQKYAAEVKTNKSAGKNLVLSIYNKDRETGLFESCGANYSASKDKSGYKKFNANKELYAGLYQIYLADHAIKTLSSSQDSFNKLYNGSNTILKSVEKSVEKLSDKKTGLPALQDGVNKLYNGSKTFSNGLNKYAENYDKLTNGLSKLNNAFSQIVDGSAKLSSGMAEYKTSGIDKITKLADDLHKDEDKFKTLSDYAKDYKFTSTNSDAQYETKFVTVIENN
jgi:X-X-X-Leu-X-X-Gly heptad repeat protein